MTTQFDAVIVGAGFGGMGAAIQLKELGLTNLAILDREDDLGGTWHVNHYPGLAVDIPSATYSYSFEPNPYWSRLFAPGSELKQYAAHVAEKHDLRKYMRFNTPVSGARWDEEGQHWVVATESGETLTGKYLLTATGYLSQPKMPDIAGIESFAGKVIHTTKWDNSYRAAGHKIGLISTGATAVQLIPELAKDAQHLTVYQRTPIWVVPKADAKVPGVIKKLFAKVPRTQKIARTVGSAILEVIMVGGVLHFRQFRQANNGAAMLAKAHLFAQVRDRELRRKLTPDYDFGCTRPTFSNTYFRAFSKKNVSLETASIERIEPDGIVTADGRKTVIDTLVLATGFNLWESAFPAFEVVGREDYNLGKFWRDNRFQAFEGIAVPKFPNLLTLNGPYSYSGLSYFDTIESQMRHIKRLFGEMARTGTDTFEVTDEANTEFLNRMVGNLDNSVFYLGSCQTARSYYFNQHGEAALLRPTSTASAYKEQESFPLEAYQLA